MNYFCNSVGCTEPDGSSEGSSFEQDLCTSSSLGAVGHVTTGRTWNSCAGWHSQQQHGNIAKNVLPVFWSRILLYVRYLHLLYTLHPVSSDSFHSQSTQIITHIHSLTGAHFVENVYMWDCSSPHSKTLYLFQRLYLFLDIFLSISIYAALVFFKTFN